MVDTLYDVAKRVGPSDWVVDMYKHYNEHRFFRAEDILNKNIY